MNEHPPLSKLFVLVSVATAGLVACGAGSAAAGNLVRVEVAANDERQSALLTSTDSTWTKIANEGLTVELSEPTTVRYGADSNWISRSVSGRLECTSRFFGSDPAPGVTKQCQKTTTQSNKAVPIAELKSPRTAARILFSGHSLTDNPLPEYVESIAQSLSTQVSWNQQNIPGSPIRHRTRGGDTSVATFPGYSLGKNRTGSGMNIVNELRQPQTIDGHRYDTLILTERHDLIDTLTWEDTVRYTRHFHERLVAGNAQSSTYLYHSWLEVPDKSNPSNWIAFERTVATAWQCVAARINHSLASENRRDRVVYLPAGLALTALVEQATQGTGVAGVTGSNVRETVGRIFSDDVHLTRMGVYYMALVNYASVYRRSPMGAWAPSGVSPTQASSLQAVAWQSVANHYKTFVSPDLHQCRTAMRESVCSAFWTFKNRTDKIAGCSSFFSGTTQNNPFYYNATTDGAYWFPAP
jgi:hypothetical protein